MARLRGPNGCPWDKEQDHKSLKPYLIEEAHEVLEAIDSENDSKFANSPRNWETCYRKLLCTLNLPMKGRPSI
jgi:NTP pyrophosphatase (non-canonical NTP hydrolase)